MKQCKLIKAYTDYPLIYEHVKDTVYKITVLSYDQDKYCKVLYDGEIYEIKAGYIYSTPVRYGAAGWKLTNPRKIERMINTDITIEYLEHH